MNEKRSLEPVRTSFAQDAIENGVFRPLARGGEAVQHLRQALERVQSESVSLVRVAASLEEFVRQQEGRYAELEQELNDTALLYVASYQLQARSEPKEVLRHVRELLEQLVGVESFALYLGAAGGLAIPVASKGVRGVRVGAAAHQRWRAARGLLAQDAADGGGQPAAPRNAVHTARSGPADAGRSRASVRS